MNLPYLLRLSQSCKIVQQQRSVVQILWYRPPVGVTRGVVISGIEQVFLTKDRYTEGQVVMIAESLALATWMHCTSYARSVAQMLPIHPSKGYLRVC